MVVLVYMLGGMSSRFGGSPKSLCKVGPNDETLLEISLNQALIQPFSKLVFITNPLTEHLFQTHLLNEYQNRPIQYIQQTYDVNTRSRPWGTTDAVCTLQGHLDEPFILVNGDDIYGEKAFETGYRMLSTMTDNVMGTVPIYKTIHNNSVVNRGVVYVNKNNKQITRLKEELNISKPTHPELMHELGSVNFIGLQPNILSNLCLLLKQFKETHKGEAKIEALLPNDLNTIIQSQEAVFHTFVIEDEIKSLTYQADIETMKAYLKN